MVSYLQLRKQVLVHALEIQIVNPCSVTKAKNSMDKQVEIQSYYDHAFQYQQDHSH